MSSLRISTTEPSGGAPLAASRHAANADLVAAFGLSAMNANASRALAASQSAGELSSPESPSRA
jgi:hypothetical protein